MSVGASAAGGDRRGVAEVREGGFGLDRVRVVTSGEEHLAGDFGSNYGKGKQGGGDLVQELMKLLVGFGDLLLRAVDGDGPVGAAPSWWRVRCRRVGVLGGVGRRPQSASGWAGGVAARAAVPDR
jgi:hypothetical protein